MAQDNPLRLLARKLEQHAPLSDEDREDLLALPCQLQTLEPHSYTLREGEKPHVCAVLLSGFAFRHKLTRDGARQIVSVHIPGDALDFQNVFLQVADHNVQTLTRAEVALIERADLLALAVRRPAIGHAILITALIESSIFREWVVNVGRRHARARIAHLLCEFAVRLRAQELCDEYAYELPMTQEQLADATGLTPVHVNRTLKGLEREGLLTRERRMISFPNWERLRDVGDFNPRYLHLEVQRV